MSFYIHDHRDMTAAWLKIGLAFVFLWVAGAMYINPSAFFHYLPAFLTQIVSPELFLRLFGVYEVFLALWILSGKLTFFAGVVAACTLIGITIFNLDAFPILFRNIGLICAAFALSSHSAYYK